MHLPRHSFIDQFSIPFMVHCISMWRRGSKQPPDHIPRCLYEWIKTTNGTVSVPLQEFRPIVEPVVADLHRKGKGDRPDAKELAGAVYDALSAAGVEVTIGEPRRPHGQR
jgi:hypothetical protein